MYSLFNKNPIIIKPIIKKKPVCYFIPTLSQMVKYLPAMQETQVQSPGRKDPLEREWLPTAVFLPGEFHGKKSLECYSTWGQKSQTQLSN